MTVSSAVLAPPSSAPSSLTEGQMYWSASTHAPMVWNGTAWKTVTLS